MVVYIVQKSICGPYHMFDFETENVIDSNGEAVGVFISECDANKLVETLKQKDYEDYDINLNDEDDVELYNSVFCYNVIKKDVK